MTRILIALCCAVTIAAVACSGRSPSSPSAGATITGNVVATRAGSSASSSAVTVSVSGTDLSTGVEPSGSFRLGGVPAGDVQLTFSSEGATSTVSVANVTDEEVVDLQVLIADGRASVLNEARGNGPSKGRGVAIRKLTNGEHASKAPGPAIPVGSPVSWTYVILNTSRSTFTSLTVTDDQGVEVACPRELPPPGESITCTGSGTAEAGQYHNIGTVIATAGVNLYADRDESFYFGVPEGRGVTIRKLTNGTHVSQAPGPSIPVGSPVSWTYVVTNASTFTFTSLTVTDDQGVTVVCPRELPPPGASITCTGSGTAVPGQYHNVGTVRATADGNLLVDRDDSFYFGGRREDEPSQKVSLCHRTGNGSFHMIEVSVDAEPAHRAHGDGKVGDPVPGRPGMVFTPSCGMR